jgi:hypothetical protein
MLAIEEPKNLKYSLARSHHWKLKLERKWKWTKSCVTNENDGLKFQAKKKPKWMKKNEHEKNGWKKLTHLVGF